MEFDFDWDDANTGHVARHEVSIVEFEQVFENQPQIEYDFTDADGEDRYNAFGFTNAGRNLKLSFTFRGDLIRPITATDITTGHVTKQERTHEKNKPAKSASAAAAKTMTKAKDPILLEGRSKEDFREGLAVAKRTGRPVKFVNGLAVRRTDPDKVAALLASAKKNQTTAISLRLEVSDLDEAKRLASKHGVGYQTLLKQIIHEALGRAS